VIDHRELRAEVLEIDLDLDTDAAREQFRPGVEWFSVYAESAKVGYIRNERIRNEDGSFAFRTRSELHKNPIGEGPLTFEIEAQLDDALQLIAFDGSVDAGLVTLEASAAVDGDALAGSLTGLGMAPTPFRFPLDRRPAFDQSLRPLLLQRDLEAGRRYEFDVLDPLTLQTRPTVIRYEGVEKLDIMGGERRAHHLVQEVAGQRLDVWVNDLGEVLSEELPGGFSAVRESEAEALWGLDLEATAEAQAEVEAEAERRRRWYNPKPVPRGIPQNALKKAASAPADD
jgi:hypothetical protein